VVPRAYGKPTAIVSRLGPDDMPHRTGIRNLQKQQTGLRAGCCRTSDQELPDVEPMAAEALQPESSSQMGTLMLKKLCEPAPNRMLPS
jgi:hypothetical protein